MVMIFITQSSSLFEHGKSEEIWIFSKDLLTSPFYLMQAQVEEREIRAF